MLLRPQRLGRLGAGRDQPGPNASPPATATVAAATTSVARPGTTTGDTLPTLPATTCHAHRPRTRPAGTPTASAVTASAVACHSAVPKIWRPTQPMVISTARSRR